MRTVIRGLIGFATAYGALTFAEMSGIDQMWRRVVLVVVVYAVGVALGLWRALDGKRGRR